MISSIALAASLLSAVIASLFELVNRQTSTDPLAPRPGWKFVGCYSDNGGNFNMNFAGTEFSTQCFCDFNIQGTAMRLDDSACNLPCVGDSAFTCGGAGAITIYQSSNTGLLSPPRKPQSQGTGLSMGASREKILSLSHDAVAPHPRTLLERFTISSGVTIKSCTAQCEAAGFSISGLEFGQECAEVIPHKRRSRAHGLKLS
ncbi:hypothetical protein D9613_006434 [Agrocybe pediades]|uniref:WSC domain-containing protein n=1 Tax=Agrocybe pediades TaxID=84607 RepID=A0A8H4QUL4_9AGAR|nr:hypothetical protein D9613_006434 [Agrocybe pediades]